MRKSKVLIIIFLLLNPWSGHLFAQETMKYDSTYLNKLGIPGKASFSYYSKGKDIIKNGDFKFTSIIKDSLCATNINKEEWLGSYEENIKNGNWIYTKQHFEIVINAVNEEGISYDFYETKSVLKINYIKGYPEGQVSYDVDLYKNKIKIKDLEHLELTITDHSINSDVNYTIDTKDQQLDIKGKASAGLMDSDWVFNNKKNQKTESRIYKNGVLLSMMQYQENDTISKVVFPLSSGIKQVLNEEETTFEMINAPLSLTFSDGYPKTSHLISIQNEGNSYLEEMINIIFKYDPSIDRKKGLILGTNRGLYLLSDDEKILAKEWIDLMFGFRKKLQKISDQLITHVAFNEDTLIRVIKKWETCQQELLDYLKPWSTIIQNDQLKYYNREGLLINYAKDVLESDTIQIDNSTLLFNYTDTINYQNTDKEFLSYIVHNFQNRILKADSLLQALEYRASQLHLTDEINLLSVALVTQKDSIKSLYNSVGSDKITSEVLNNINLYFLGNHFNKTYNTFIKTTPLVAQKEAGAKLQNRLKLLNEIYKESIKIDKRHKFLDSLYTEITFDPFTYAQVPTRVKKRLYQVAINEMIPEILNSIKAEENTATDIVQKLMLITEIQKQLVFLREVDTKKTERKLKRSKSIDKRLEILKVQ